MYALGQAAFDHNFSQGLSLQQTYSGGAGWTVIKSAKQTLDLKGTMSYISQRFNGAANKSLIGSVFGEAYHRNLPAGIKFDEQLTLIPAWNNTNAYSANGGAGITMALYKRLSLNVSTLDTLPERSAAELQEELVPVHDRSDVFAALMWSRCQPVRDVRRAHRSRDESAQVGLWDRRSVFVVCLFPTSYPTFENAADC